MTSPRYRDAVAKGLARDPPDAAIDGLPLDVGLSERREMEVPGTLQVAAADVLAEAEIYGLPVDRPEWVVEQLQALTRDDVEAAARRWIRPDELRVTVGLPGGH